MFPHGGPGVGLLFLRLAAAIVISNELSRRSGSAVFHWIPVVLIVLAASLALGFMTPIASTLAFIFQIAGLISHSRNSDAAFVIASALAFLALVLLGPGGYSVDGYLFGRRVLVRPDELE
jgi:uncharacterized membrane protein YphA (DoxX/SURF4 family)